MTTNNALEDFLHRTTSEGTHHYNGEADPDDARDIDAWGNEWETGYDDENYD